MEHADAVDHGELEPPDTLHGQLQRGRGLGARRALTERGAADLIFDCIRRDPRQDHQVESRTWYLAWLAVELDLSVEPIAAHLVDPADESGDEWRVDLAIGVLVDMARRGRDDAVAPLRRYVGDGRHWQWALDKMWDSAGPAMCHDLDRVVLARLDDATLHDAVDPDWGPWTAWSHTQARIREALASRRDDDARPAQRRQPTVQTATRTHLITLVRQSCWPALVELGRRGELVVLDLAEEPGIRNNFGGVPQLTRALRRLGAAALPRARNWAVGDDPLLVSHGVDVLAAHGDDDDVPVLMRALTEAARVRDWCAVEGPARGLGRLRVAQAASPLADAWTATSHSYARADILTGLCGAAPQSAGRYVDEAIEDCEPRVRRFACGAASGPGVLARLQARRDDPLEDDAVRAAASHR